MIQFPERFQPFIRTILDYYTLPHIEIVVENRDDFVACQGMSTVHISKNWIKNSSDDAIQTVLAHEISHRTLLPGTAVEQETHVIISQLEGLNPNNVYNFLNIIYDLSIDRTNILHRQWSDLYITGMEQLLPTRLGIKPVTKPDKWPFTTAPLSPESVFANLLVAMVYDRYQWDYILREIEQHIYELLYINNRPFERRLVDLARIFKELYKIVPEEPQPNQNTSNEQSQNGESSNNSQSQQQSNSNNQSDSEQNQSNNSSDGNQDSNPNESEGKNQDGSGNQQDNSEESSDDNQNGSGNQQDGSEESSDNDQSSGSSGDSSNENSNSQDSNKSSSGNSSDESSENSEIDDKFKAKVDKKLPFDRNLTEEELKEVAKKLAEIYDDIPDHIPVDPTIRIEFKKRRAKKMALPLIAAGNNTHSRELTPAGTWTSSCPAHELNMIKTIAMNGVFIPDFTTRRVKDTLVKGTPAAKKNPHLVILADVSGSMRGFPVEQLIDVTIALNMVAKRKGWPVSLIKFNTMAYTLVEKSWDYNKTEDIAARLEAGGNTSILSAVAKAEKLGKGLAVFIITDEKNSSLTKELTLQYFRKIKNNKSEIFLYAIGNKFTAEERKLLKPYVKEAFCIPKDQPFAASIISNAMKL